jgi:hypothetical protein
MLGRLCLRGATVTLPFIGSLPFAAAASAQTPPPVTTSAAFPPSTAPAAAPPPPAASTPAAPTPAPVTVYCLPACRAGYTCLEGRCVSACNPPCSAGETCTADAQCVSNTPPAPAAPPAAVPVAEPVPPGPPPDAGWARGAGVYGIVAALGTLGLAIGSEMTKDEQVPSLPLGVSATLLVGASGPIVAVGASSARESGDVKGAQGLRITGWIAYGLTLADASVLIAMGASEVEPVDGLITSVGALGAVSLLSFAADAFFSAAEADAKLDARPKATSFALRPALAWSRAPDGALVPVLGAHGSF